MLTQAKESILDDSDCVHALGSKELILLSILGSILGFRVFYCFTITVILRELPGF